MTQLSRQQGLVVAIENHIRAIEENMAEITEADQMGAAGVALADLLEKARDHFRQLSRNAQSSQQAPQSQPAAPEPQSQPLAGEGLESIVDGFYTVSFPDGDYATLKLSTQAEDASFAPGKQVAYYLNGPDNWQNYKGFAFVEGHQPRFWRSAPQGGKSVVALHILLGSREAMIAGLKGYARQSGKCGVCGKMLTTPESIELGIGPVCAARIGL